MLSSVVDAMRAEVCWVNPQVQSENREVSPDRRTTRPDSLKVYADRA